MFKCRPLDIFISPILGFEGDIPIPAILISAQTPTGESGYDSSTGPRAGSSRTWASKCKATATPPPLKKAKKVVEKMTGGVKINDPAPNLASTPTPPNGPRSKFIMSRSNRYV
jgi:hypothetical protein